jgi:hypothetical protein
MKKSSKNLIIVIILGILIALGFYYGLGALFYLGIICFGVIALTSLSAMTGPGTGYYFWPVILAKRIIKKTKNHYDKTHKSN